MTDMSANHQDPNSTAPHLRVLSQIVKDLSFENPEANRISPNAQVEPNIDVGIEVNANPHSGGSDLFEVNLSLKAQATRAGDVLFIAELVYSGLFQLKNIPQQDVEPILLVDCPRLLFPFARRILAEVTREGGYPPLMIDPVDFVSLYRQQHAQQNAQTGQA